MSSLLDFLNRQSKITLWMAAVSFALVLGVVDYFTGFEISFSFFYLGPVAIAAWTLGRNSGYFISTVCAAVWLSANLLAGEQFSTPMISYWNALTRLGFFLVVTYLLTGLYRLLEHEKVLARTDFLTGALNLRAFTDSATREIARVRRNYRPFSLLYLDLDNFKALNDRLGHTVGDHLLQTVAFTLSRCTRANDIAARLGGDEFALLLPETGHEAMKVVAPRIQAALVRAMEHHDWGVTFSLGALTFEQSPDDVEQMIELADQLMYRAKKAGKNAIVYAVHSPEEASAS
jgi:diguanylate cyclase (GGDEF)-like protein